jgi:transcriptional regulator PpsR
MRPFGASDTTLGGLEGATVGTLLTVANDISLIVDANGVVRDLSSNLDALSSSDAQALVGQPLVDIVTVESRPKVLGMLRDVAAGASGSAPKLPTAVGNEPSPRWRQVNAVLPGGTELPLLLAAAAIGAGRTLFCGRDLRATAALQQRLVEAQLAMERDYWKFRNAETRYRHLFQVASEAVLVVDATSLKILEANPAATRLLGDGGALDLHGAVFPLGLDARGAESLSNLMASVRATGRTESARVELANAGGEQLVSVSSYRQERNTHFVVRLSPVHADALAGAAPSTSAMLLKLVQSAPDCLVVTDLEGRVISANMSFIELAQLTTEEQVRGESLDRWLGRTGVDLSVLISNLRQRGAVRLFATTLRGEYGAVTDVEISATMVPHGERPFLGFTIRDVGRRLSGEARAKRELPRSVGQLTELVGRVPLKDIVGETSDLIEQLCIEAALELTRDNRASAAEMLGLSRQSLYVKLRRYGVGDLPPGDADK